MATREDLYRRFWRLWIDRTAGEEYAEWRRPRATGVPHDHHFDMVFPLFRGTRICNSFNRRQQIGCELYIPHDKSLFERLRGDRDPIERAYGATLEWQESGTRDASMASRIVEYRPGSIEEEGKYHEFIEWMIDSGTRLRRALKDYGPAST